MADVRNRSVQLSLRLRSCLRRAAEFTSLPPFHLARGVEGNTRLRI